MQKQSFWSGLFFALVICVLAACSSIQEAVHELRATDIPPTPTVEPLSDVFKSAINDFITAGSKLNAATSQGVNYVNYRDYYAEVGGAFDLALASWPENFAPEAKEQFAKALWGWDLTGVIWDAQIQGNWKHGIREDHPRFHELKEYADGYLSGTGTRVYVTNDNIGTLLTLASEQFEAGRDIMLPLLQ